MTVRKRLLQGVVLALVASVSALGPVAAEAAVPLSCPSGDYRSVADALPRPGVVVKQSYASTDYYYPATIGEDGSLNDIWIDNKITDPLVATWQNGTNCSGSEISRNAWAVGPTGRVYTGNGFSGPAAYNFGDASALPLNKPIVGMSPTSTGNGYWLVASDGGIFTYGDANFYGSTGALTLNKPIVGMSVTPTGAGYWLVASDGGIFCFGDARFFGSMGAVQLNRPVTGMTTTPSGNGYWMVADDGGIFTFGDAVFKGSTGSYSLAAPIAGMIPWSAGYMLIGQDGELYPFG